MTINLNIQPIDYGIPYKGSKRVIAYDLICQMSLYKPKATHFIDLFGGGGAMSFMALQLGYNVIYNEYDTDLSKFVLYVVDRIKNGKRGKYGLFDDEWYKFVNRETFISQLKEHTNYSTFCKIAYSFGNNGRNYLFNPETEKFKHLAHDFVVFQDWNALLEFNKLQNVNFTMPLGKTILERRFNYLAQVRLAKKRIDLEQLERLQQLEQLERLQQLEQLQQLERLERLQQLEQLEQLEQLQINNKSYDEIEIPFSDEDVIIYCDTPYRGTDGYNSEFDFDKFDNWFKNHEKTIFLSEYSSPHKSIFEIKKRCTLSKGNNSLVKIERLYCNKNIDVVKSNKLQLALEL